MKTPDRAANGDAAGAFEPAAVPEKTAAPAHIHTPRIFAPPLISALSTLSRLRGRQVPIRRLVAALPGGFAPPSPEDCLKAAADSGMRCRALPKRKIADIPLPALPCALLLAPDSDGHAGACVLTEMDPESGKAKAIFPETEPEAVDADLAKLQSVYRGAAIFAPRAERIDQRAESLRPAKPRYWFWNVLREYAPIYRDVAIASLVVNLLTLASPLFIMNVYDRVVPNNATYTLWVLVLGLMAAHGMDFLLRNLRSYFVDVAGRNADVTVGSMLMERVLHMRLDNRPESVGGLVNNLREFDQVRDFFGSATLLALFDLPFLLLFVVLVGFIGGPIVALVLLALPVMLLFVRIIQIPFQRSVERQFAQNMQKNSLLVEIVSGLETIKSSLAQGQLKKQWENVVDAASGEAARTRRLASLAGTGTLLITYIINAGVIIWGVYRINDGLLTQGGLIACVILVSRALGPLMQIAAMLTQMQRSRTALKALDIIMSLPTEQQDTGVADSEGLSAEVALEQVRFSYPGGARPALLDVNLRIRPGEKVGIIGATGSGKSTLGRLLAGLYQPQEGSVLFGGIDIRQMHQAELRGRVAFLPQENFLLYGSVRENIGLGSPWLDMKNLVLAAEISGVSEFVKKHPLGYDMPVGERGAALSGGQRQAVALARTLARPADVFVLDEPSSNLDMEAEHRLMMRLAAFMRHKTLVIMTHRPSLLALAERLVVLHDGAVVADGPRDAVLRRLHNKPQKPGARP